MVAPIELLNDRIEKFNSKMTKLVWFKAFPFSTTKTHRSFTSLIPSSVPSITHRIGRPAAVVD